MVLNKQRAEILIGAQLGYVNTTVTPTSSTQSVQFLEVGTQLRIRPFISSDDRIRLEIHPELSTGRVKTEGGFTLPEKEVTKVTTNVMASNGCTVVIGGLLREDLENTKSQIPVLGDMPLLGALFRHKIEKTQRQEILVLLTPRIVCEPGVCQSSSAAMCELLDRRETFRGVRSPLSRRARRGDRPSSRTRLGWPATSTRHGATWRVPVLRSPKPGHQRSAAADSQRRRGARSARVCRAHAGGRAGTDTPRRGRASAVAGGGPCRAARR